MNGPLGTGRREFLRLSAMAGGAALVTACIPGGGSPPPEEDPGRAGEFELGRLQGSDVITDASQFPRSFKEAPELAALVQQGRLPAVAERIGQDPLVLKPFDAIGTYGGTLRKPLVGTTRNDGTVFRFAAGPDSLLYYDWRNSKEVPNIARAWEVSSDGRVVTVMLRRGMRWSDGQPFTADDILFWYEDYYLNPQLNTSKSVALLINGKDVTIRKVDTFTVEYVSPDPNFLMQQLLTGASRDLGGQTNAGDLGMGGYMPKHYLSKFHPKYTAQAEVDRIAREAQSASWQTYFRTRNDWLVNVEVPLLAPWRPVTISTQAFTLERNPYSIWVDTEGNQLPYIGRLEHTSVQNVEVVSLRAAAGEYDFIDRHLGVDKLPFLIESQERGNYKVHLDPGQTVDFGLGLNLAYVADAEIGTLLRTTDFRRALSLGVQREQVNEAFFLGTGTPSAPVPAPTNPYFPGNEWVTKWATHDPEQANRLLDGIGYTAKDADGYRLRKDNGQRLRLNYDAAVRFGTDMPAIGEMIKTHWRDIGVDLNVQSGTPTLLTQRIAGNELQMTGNSLVTEEPFLLPDLVVPYSTGGPFSAIIGVPYARWFRSGGAQGTEPFPELKRMYEMWTEGYSAPPERRIEIGKELHRMHADLVFSIGVAGQGLVIYGLRYASNTLGNMPARIVNGTIIRTTMNAHPMAFYYK